MKVERAIAGFLGVEVDFPGLAERVGFDEVPLVVNVETMVHGVVLQLRNVPCDIDHGHSHNASGGQPIRPEGEGDLRLPALRSWCLGAQATGVPR